MKGYVPQFTVVHDPKGLLKKGDAFMDKRMPEVVDVSSEYKASHPAIFRKRSWIRVATRMVKFFFQRLFRGFDDSECWNLDGSLARLIVPRLKRFKEIGRAHPHDLTQEKWDEYLDEMISAFEFFAGDARFDCDTEQFDKANVGLNLFAKHFGNLWD